MNNTVEKYKDVLEKTLRYSKKQDYTGYDYWDGMSSKILQSLPFESKWVNIIFQEALKRSPVNIRPLLFVQKKQSFKGTALFTLANLRMADITDDDYYMKEAKDLLNWLIKNQSETYEPFCGGHRHATQGMDKKVDANVPGIVSTSYAVKALLEGKVIAKDYALNAATAKDFLFNQLGYEEFENGARMGYKPSDSGEYYTLNSNALGARMLIEIYEHTGEDKLKESARKILDYVVSCQTDIGGWIYRDPPSASHLSMDNHHNGFIIESLLRYQEVTNSDRFEEALEKSLEFYKEVLHNEDGSPNWDEESEYPKDIHASAQGIITFTEAEDMDFAKKILDWTLDNLYAGDGRFYYQKRRFYTKKFTLMRWCQAWMAYAISNYLINLKR